MDTINTLYSAEPEEHLTSDPLERDTVFPGEVPDKVSVGKAFSNASQGKGPTDQIVTINSKTGEREISDPVRHAQGQISTELNNLQKPAQ